MRTVGRSLPTSTGWRYTRKWSILKVRFWLDGFFFQRAYNCVTLCVNWESMSQNYLSKSHHSLPFMKKFLSKIAFMLANSWENLYLVKCSANLYYPGKILVCQTCGKECLGKRRLHNHITSKHPKGQKFVPCQYCGQVSLPWESEILFCFIFKVLIYQHHFFRHYLLSCIFVIISISF